MSVAIVAWGARSPLGGGEAAFVQTTRATRVAKDDELARAGLLRPFCARADVRGDRDRATELLEEALSACSAHLDAAMPGWRDRRVGLAVGTSSGGMRTFETNPASFEGTYLGPLVAAARPRAFAPFSLVLGACASATIAIGLARAWLDAGECDVAIAGGFDAISVFVAAGFEALRATTAQPGPRPFRKGRDGLSLGEGAAFLALARSEDAGPRALAFVNGFGASCDAVHLTAPDREGKGLARAAAAALDDAGRPRVGLLSAHGTATEFNDASEARAIHALGCGDVPVHAFKGAIGHTLGAAGALETLAAVDALRRGVVPPTSGNGDVDGGVVLPDEPGVLGERVALKLSSAFGGANAALVLSLAKGSRRPPREAFLTTAVAVDAPLGAHALASRTGYAEEKIARADDLVRITMTAIAALEDRVGPLRGAGIVVGHGLATIETNARFRARIREAGPTRAEPRRFPFTTPNAPAGECAVAFGLTGPAFGVGGGPHGGIEALEVARDLVRAGVADRIVVVAADDAGEATKAIAPETRSGAVATLVSAAPVEAAARIEECRVELGTGSAADATAVDAHRALLPLASGRPRSLDAVLPWGGFAKASLFWL